jgi:hypothetical protein
MSRTTLLTLLVAWAVCPAALAVNVIFDRGTWPDTWPKELEPLRKRAMTIRGGAADTTTYAIPFTKRKEFEAAWPQLLKIKSSGGPIVLKRGPDQVSGRPVTAGVLVQCPPGYPSAGAKAPAPIPGASSLRERWMQYIYIELIVDGNVVDPKRITFPAGAPVIDTRSDGGSGGPAPPRK